MSDLRDRIISFAKKKNLTVNGFETRCGLSVGTIAKCGESISTNNLAKMLKAFPDMDAYEILGIIRLEGEERMKMVARHCAGGNQAELARKLGISHPTVNRLCTGEIELTPHYADLIVSAYPQVSWDFLLTGRGYPGDLSVDLVRERYIQIVDEKDRLIASLQKELDIQRRMIEKLL